MLRPYAAASSPIPLLRHAAPPVASRRRQSGTSIRPAVYRAERHAVDERTTLRFLRLDDSPLMRSAGDVGHVPGLRVHTASRPLLLLRAPAPARASAQASGSVPRAARRPEALTAPR